VLWRKSSSFSEGAKFFFLFPKGRLGCKRVEKKSSIPFFKRFSKVESLKINSIHSSKNAINPTSKRLKKGYKCIPFENKISKASKN
jgi:hypothetical protein